MSEERIRINRMVAKIGSFTLTEGGDPLDLEFMDSIAKQIYDIKVCIKSGAQKDVLLVSSGAVASGRAILKKAYEHNQINRAWWSNGEGDDLDPLLANRAAAGFGQGELSGEWKTALRRHGLLASQVLLSGNDLAGPCAEETRRALELTYKIGIPVINANDAVSSFEMKKLPVNADNDYLAFSVANLVGADTLVLLTDQDGVMDAQGNLIEYARSTDDVRPFIKSEGKGIGGMLSKVMAAYEFIYRKPYRVALIANGKRENVLVDAAKWKSGIGTWFATMPQFREDRRYIVHDGT